jgi:hypothetical protein
VALLVLCHAHRVTVSASHATGTIGAHYHRAPRACTSHVLQCLVI